MEQAPDRPNVALGRGPDGAPVVVLAFPYDPQIVGIVRGIPGRRFDWDRREWSAPVDDWAGVHVAEILDRFPELTTSAEVDVWLRAVERRWIGRVRTTRHDGHGWFVLERRAGTLPPELDDVAIRVPAEAGSGDGALLAPLTPGAARAIAGMRAARLDAAAHRCVLLLEHGEEVAPARLALHHGVEGERLRLEVLWDPDAGEAFARLPGVEPGGRTLPLDPWIVGALDGYLALHGIAVDASARAALAELRAEHDAAAGAIRRSRATAGEPIPAVAAVLGGTLQPFQWAGVRYVLDARRAFLADEQGLGKTVQALAALEADGAFPAVVVCPASLKLTWEREAHRWLAHRSVAVIQGRPAAPPTAEITIVNFEVVAAHREALGRLRPRALVVDESHLVKNPQAKRTQAVRRLAAAVAPDGLRLALTGTPVLNHAEELVSQLRVLGRLEEFGSGARFTKQFAGPLTEERLHWHLRRRCFVRRLKSEVLPQLPAKRRVVVPVALDNEREYRLAERDVVAWLREQPLDLAELDAKIARTLRAERLAQLGALQRIAARGKLHAALAWIHDFLASGEPLVVFARHIDVQEAIAARFPDALHLFGRDDLAARDAAVRAFQDPDGPQLIVGATRVAGQGLTLTRASNVAFVELEWTPALHDQAEDRCHRIGQRDAVTAWYLLAAGTIDETMARLLESKRTHIDAVTDGRRLGGRPLVDELARELREGGTYRRLRAVG
ncbi:MAG TPA: DEAD/DEAH box helicase [Solirubrobacteraceae bacterium]|nr:DEAD/DEAH box helicase [Solirubrobacteraceae bacterium]